MGVPARYWLGRTNQLTRETEWYYFMIIVRGGSGRSQSVFHADMNQVAGVMCVFKFGLASLVGVPFPPRTVVRVHRSGYTELSILYIQHSEWNLPKSSEPSFIPDCQQSLLNSQPLPAVSGSRGCRWNKSLGFCLASVKENVAGGHRSDRLSCLKNSEKRDLSSPLRSQSTLNKRSSSANKYSS